MRLPLVLRSTMEAALESQRGLYNNLLGEKEHENLWLLQERQRLGRLYAEADNLRIDSGAAIVQLKDELARLREHFEATVKAKDEAYQDIWDCWDQTDRWNVELLDSITSLGILPPGGWAYPTPCWATIVITSDINGVKPCQTSPPSPTG